jgi:hypothetical protein
VLPEGDVLGHVQVLEERIALEHGVDVAAIGRDRLDRLPLEEDAPLRGLLEPGDHPQRGRLAAAGGTQQREELAAADLDPHVLDGLRLTEPLSHALEPDRRDAVDRRARLRLRRGRFDARVDQTSPPSSAPLSSRLPTRRGRATARAVVASEISIINVPMALIVGVTPNRIEE